MAVSLTTCAFSIIGQAVLQSLDLLVHAPSDRVQIGVDGFPSLSWSLDDGTEAGQGNEMFVARLSVPPGGSILLDLSDGSLTNFRGEPIAFESIKVAVFAVNRPDGTKRLFIGPQGVAGGARLWFRGEGVDAAEEVYQATIHVHPDAGWPVSVTGGSVLEFHAPDTTPGDVDVNVILIGVAA